MWVADAKRPPQCVQMCASPADNPLPKKCTLVLPVSQVFCLPLWLNETEATRLAGMITLQLESRGTGNRENVPIVHQWSIVEQEPSRTLVMVGILPPSLPASFHVESYQAFDLSARYLPWSQDAITLWQEQGQLSMAFTRSGKLAYFQSLGEERCNDRALQALTCLRVALEIQSVITSLAEIVVWADLTAKELAALQAELALPIRQVDRANPVPPRPSWNLCPPEVTRFQKSHQARRWQGRGLLIALAVYLLFVSLLVGRFWHTSAEVKGLRTWSEQHTPALNAMRESRLAWQRLQPVVDTANYPLELLLHVASGIPKDQLHLTLFGVEEGKISLSGEATQVAAAYKFFDALKAEPHLAGYSWVMSEPHLLPNDLAQFQIEGTRATSNP